MFANCKIYNQPGSIIYSDAELLETDFLNAYNESKESGESVKVVRDGKIQSL
jgi:hypothetical protein